MGYEAEETTRNVAPTRPNYLIRIPARLLIRIKHELLSELFDISVQHRTHPVWQKLYSRFVV